MLLHRIQRTWLHASIPLPIGVGEGGERREGEIRRFQLYRKKGKLAACQSYFMKIGNLPIFGKKNYGVHQDLQKLMMLKNKLPLIQLIKIT